MKLRPHHLLCTQCFSGKGYGESFVENMTAIVAQLRSDSPVLVDIISSTDDICQACPRMLAVDCCSTNDKVKKMDAKVREYFDIQEKSYLYNEVVKTINNKMTPAILADICGNCEWYPFGMCQKALLK